MATVKPCEETGSNGPVKLPPINPKRRYSRNLAKLPLICESEGSSRIRNSPSATPPRLPSCNATTKCTATNPTATSSEERRGGRGSGCTAAASAPPTDSHHCENPLTKFRKTARMVKDQIAWTKVLAKDAEEHLKTHTVQTKGDGQPAETLTFNLNAFRPEVQPCGTLNPRAKTVLMKPSWNRTEQDLAFLQRFTRRLKCFDRYPLYVRKELASVLYYEAFEKGRVVIRQGDSGFNFYFIVSGSVLVEVQEEDQLTWMKHNMIVGELGSGSAFGELALLHDAKRRATIVCKEQSEFLKIDKPDFDMVLRRNHEREWEKRLAHLQSHRFFKDWTPEKLKFAVEGSLIVEYPSNTVIIKDLSLLADRIYLIISGNCKVVQRVELIESQFGKPETARLSLPPIGTSATTGNHNPKGHPCRRVKKWWVLRTLVPGDYFGVGEGKEKGIKVVSDHKVECLLVNKMVLLKHERGRCLTTMQGEVAKLYPSKNQAFQSYIESKKWADYKRKLVLQTVARSQRRQGVASKPTPI